ncbi:alpha mannosidase-like protein [Gloeophyllum trabeum ATCC 11539]|uniref:alpha-1,2-Mannosidase n=1 Tax=Gloeophyllum trabeum (strain ATCC 11539 / FP-39264 / Madison 617) TaxID=670483 RepID=S7RWL4_GLOTA|nr:alpha mannosidase-like protein [Gloeophyllum trabeum ATCC 11539]EPQ59290.1 alpha mannosidase-like protein [Gloeophyllum trabeum ATCC 11539]
MDHAFPFNQLAPLSCTGRGPDWTNPTNIASNDVAGNFSLTLIDSLDTLVVLGDKKGFEDAVRNVIGWVSFDVNTKPQVFETTIRVLGGLLSGHIFANEKGGPFHLPWYQGELLNLAHDLGRRLLPAFGTPTGIPYARINLRHGVQRGETLETCTAGAGSLILEFGTLSRLVGDDRFEKAAYKAFFALWNRRSDIGLVGNTINTWSGVWTHPEVTGIGAGIDSFYEYALKWYVLSGEMEFLDVWHESYAAIMRYARATDGFWFRSVSMHTGDIVYYTTDSLSAFWAGLQVLAGDVENAIKAHLVYWNIWKRHAGLPEVYDTNFMYATSLQYPLRPEFVESTWYLYRATGDPFYLDVGERILNDITMRAKVECGLAGIQDLRTNQRDDRMESFVLSETLKYLFLLFDEDNPFNHDDSNSVFTTEGHILVLPSEHIKPVSRARRKLRRVEHLQCPAYRPPLVAIDDWERGTGLIGGLLARGDIDYARELVAMLPTEADKIPWSPEGWCDVPQVEPYSYDFLLSPNGQAVPEDASPGLNKLRSVPDGFIVHNVTGIRTHIVRRLDGRGYDVTKLGPHAVKTGQLVYINDTELILAAVDGVGPVDSDQRHHRRSVDVHLRFFVNAVDPTLVGQVAMPELIDESFVTAYTALFGADPRVSTEGGHPIRFGHGHGVRVSRDRMNAFGCHTYARQYDDHALLVDRGGCTFLEKLLHAQAAGASGVVVISDDELPLNPSADQAEIEAAGTSLDEVVIVVLKKSAGENILDMLERAEMHGMGQLMVAVDPEGFSIPMEGRHQAKTLKVYDDANRVLYLNGHPLLNTRLMV